MDATTTAFKSLLKQLRSDFPALTFTPGERYLWSPHDKTVYFDANSPENAPLLLHETAHGVLGHDMYSRDIELLQLEREAWTKADEIGQRYDVVITEDTREDALDSYRDWLHERSICPSCGRNGIQTDDSQYECVVCSAKWHVNDARTCGLRRNLTT